MSREVTYFSQHVALCFNLQVLQAALVGKEVFSSSLPPNTRILSRNSMTVLQNLPSQSYFLQNYTQE